MKEVFHSAARAQILGTLEIMAVLIAIIAVRFLLETIGLSQANITAAYILGVLAVTVVTTSRWYSVSASLASVLLFNYIFIGPMFVLKAEDAGTQLTLLIAFPVAVFTSPYTVQIKEKVQLFQQDTYRSDVILDTSQILQKAATPADILSCTARQPNELLKRDITYFRQDGTGLKSLPRFREYSSPTTGRGLSPNTLEELTVTWKYFREGKETGIATEVPPAATYHFLPLQSSGVAYGVMGIPMGNTPPGDFENGFTAAIIVQCPTALEKKYMSRKQEEEAAMVRAEQLRSNLLCFIPHDLRTPLTSILGNAGVLMSDGGSLTVKHRNRVYRDIYDDSIWFINLVENLLSITRIEGQGVRLHMETELLEEVIDETMRHINWRHKHHTIKVNQIGDYILTDMGARLIIQVITNLADSAVEYMPEGSTTMVNSHQEDSPVAIDVSDNGPGILGESKGKVSEMFYTIDHKSTSGKRGMGPGLPLCRAILSVRRGTIEALNGRPAGSTF